MERISIYYLVEMHVPPYAAPFFAESEFRGKMLTGHYLIQNARNRGGFVEINEL